MEPVLIFPKFLGRVLEIVKALDQSREDFGRGVEYQLGFWIGNLPGVGTQVTMSRIICLEFLGVMEFDAGRGRIHGVS